MNSDFISTQKCPIRVYAKVKNSKDSYKIHLIDLSTNNLNSDFWNYLSTKLDFVIKSLTKNNNIKNIDSSGDNNIKDQPIISEEEIQISDLIDPSNNSEVIKNILINIFKSTELLNLRKHPYGTSSLNQPKKFEATKESKLFINNTNDFLLIEGKSNDLYPLINTKEEIKLSEKVNYIIPQGFGFIAGKNSFDCKRYTKLEIDKNLVDVSNTLINTIKHLSKISIESIEERLAANLIEEKASFDFGLNTLEDFLPKERIDEKIEYRL